MYEWNVRLGINVIAGYTSKQGYHSFEKKGGVEKPYQITPLMNQK